MAHEHAHGEGGGTYFLDQLFTILACGGVGLVAVMMYATDFLGRMLVPMFYVPVLLGGSALLVMVIVRAIAVWQLAGARAALAPAAAGHDHGHSHAHEHSHGHAHAHDDCGHDHSHGDNCDHDHGQAHDHAHAGGDDHGHDHGWAPWRYMVIAIPVFLFLLGLPRDGLNVRQLETMGQGDLKASPNRQALSFFAGGTALTKALRKTVPTRQLLGFKDLTEAAAIRVLQENLEGDIGVLRGQFIPIVGSDREFTLFRVNRTCCVADEVYLEIRIQAPEPIQGFGRLDWVQIEGVISFQRNDRGKWIPVITLQSNDNILTTDPATDTSSF